MQQINMPFVLNSSLLKILAVIPEQRHTCLYPPCQFQILSWQIFAVPQKQGHVIQWQKVNEN